MSFDDRAQPWLHQHSCQYLYFAVSFQIRTFDRLSLRSGQCHRSTRSCLFPSITHQILKRMRCLGTNNCLHETTLAHLSRICCPLHLSLPCSWERVEMHPLHLQGLLLSRTPRIIKILRLHAYSSASRSLGQGSCQFENGTETRVSTRVCGVLLPLNDALQLSAFLNMGFRNI